MLAESFKNAKRQLEAAKCGILRTVGLSVIERSELVMHGAQHAPATLVRLREERLRSRRQVAVECGVLAVPGVYAAIKVVAPSLLVGWP